MTDCSAAADSTRSRRAIRWQGYVLMAELQNTYDRGARDDQSQHSRSELVIDTVLDELDDDFVASVQRSTSARRRYWCRSLASAASTADRPVATSRGASSGPA